MGVGPGISAGNGGKASAALGWSCRGRCGFHAGRNLPELTQRREELLDGEPALPFELSLPAGPEASAVPELRGLAAGLPRGLGYFPSASRSLSPTRALAPPC